MSCSSICEYGGGSGRGGHVGSARGTGTTVSVSWNRLLDNNIGIRFKLD